MPPNNQMPNPYPPQQQDPYSFITQSPQQPTKNLGPTSMKGRIIVVAVIAVVLIIIAIIITSILGNAGNAQKEQYINIAKSQTEIIRISALAEQKARSLETKSLATTTRFAFTTSQKDISAILASNGVDQKSLAKQLSASKNTKTDELLDEAEKNSRYDETYTELIKKEIDNYKKLLSSAASGASAKDRQTLETAYNQASILIVSEKE